MNSSQGHNDLSAQIREADAAPASVTACPSTRNSASFNSSCFSLPVNFFASTPIKPQEDETRKVSRQEEIANETDLYHNCVENKSQPFSNVTCPSNTTTSSVVSNSTQSNFSQHCAAPSDVNVNNGSAERNPFFCYNSSGEIMFMDVSSPPLGILDRMMNSFRYDPTRPKITGYTKAPEKINPFNDRSCTISGPNESSTQSEVAVANAGQAAKNSSIVENIPVSGQSEVLITSASIHHAARNDSASENVPSSSQSEVADVDVHQAANSTMADKVPSFSEFEVLHINSSICHAVQNVSSSKNMSSSCQSEVALAEVHQAAKDSPIAETVPVLSQSEVLNISFSICHAIQNVSSSKNISSSCQSEVALAEIHQAAKDSPIAETVPVLSPSEVLNINSRICHAVQNASAPENIANSSQSEVAVMNVHQAAKNSTLAENVPVSIQYEVLNTNSSISQAVQSIPTLENVESSLQSEVAIADIYQAVNNFHNTPNSTPLKTRISQPLLEDLFSSPSEILNDITSNDLVSSVLEDENINFSVVMEQSINLRTEIVDNAMETEPVVASCSTATTEVRRTTGLSRIPKKTARTVSKRRSVHLGKAELTGTTSNPFGRSQKTDAAQQLTGNTVRCQVQTRGTAPRVDPSKLQHSTLVAAGLRPNSFRAGLELQKLGSMPQKSIAHSATVSRRTGVKTVTKQNSLQSRTSTAAASSRASRTVVSRASVAPAQSTAKTSKLLSMRQNLQRQLGVSKSSGTRVNAPSTSNATSTKPTAQPHLLTASTIPQRSRIKPPSTMSQLHKSGGKPN